MSAVDPNPAHIAARVVQDAFLEAWADYWTRRAEQLEAARPRPGDYPGRATPADLAASHARLTEAARACRNRAGHPDLATAALGDTLLDSWSSTRPDLDDPQAA